ncbi:MAG: hypothetical protein IPP77_14685 [Bacteroidetes bacterium]|nr:hypothetical protein [Bacteroidota bacterium]
MKSKIHTLILFSVVLSSFFISGCKKEKTEGLNGRYVIISGGLISYKFIEVTTDSLSFMLEFGSYGQRGLSSLITTFTADSVYNYSNGYPYKLEDNVLTITGMTLEPIVAVKNMEVPTAREWVKIARVTSLGNITNPASGGFGDMTSYGSDIITDPHDNGTKYVYKRLSILGNTFAATEIDADPTKIYVAYEDNVEYLNNKLLVYEWGNPNSYMNRVNVNTGIWESRTQVAVPVGNIYALAAVGTDLWGMTYDGIRKYDFVNDAWGSEYATGGASTLAGKGGFLYMSIQNAPVIQKFDPSLNKIVDAFELPNNYSLRGIAFSDNYLIASVYNYTTTSYQLIKIDLGE